ncbi:MAG: hypothetical protein ABI661_10160 [Gammaproteobacteria bacterium]
MAAPKDTGDGRPQIGLEVDADVDFAGYDPYIVAITAGGSAQVSSDAASLPDQSSAESRKVKLMAWLRQNGA